MNTHTQHSACRCLGSLVWLLLELMNRQMDKVWVDAWRAQQTDFLKAVIEKSLALFKSLD